jgi:hypothetical protein
MINESDLQLQLVEILTRNDDFDEDTALLNEQHEEDFVKVTDVFKTHATSAVIVKLGCQTLEKVVRFVPLLSRVSSNCNSFLKLFPIIFTSYSYNYIQSCIRILWIGVSRNGWVNTDRLIHLSYWRLTHTVTTSCLYIIAYKYFQCCHRDANTARVSTGIAALCDFFAQSEERALKIVSAQTIAKLTRLLGPDEATLEVTHYTSSYYSSISHHSQTGRAIWGHRTYHLSLVLPAIYYLFPCLSRSYQQYCWRLHSLTHIIRSIA